jgi:hypothetical protein
VQKQVHPRLRSTLHTRPRALTEERGERVGEKRRKKEKGRKRDDRGNERARYNSLIK